MKIKFVLITVDTVNDCLRGNIFEIGQIILKSNWVRVDILSVWMTSFLNQMCAFGGGGAGAQLKKTCEAAKTVYLGD